MLSSLSKSGGTSANRRASSVFIVLKLRSSNRDTVSNISAIRRFTSDGPLYTNLVGMAGLSSWWFSDIDKQAPKQNKQWQAIPTSGSKKYRTSDLNPNVYIIPTGAKNAEGGWAWSSFLTSPKQMERKTVADSVPAIRKSLDTPFYHKASPYNGVALTDIFPNTWKLHKFGSSH